MRVPSISPLSGKRPAWTNAQQAFGPCLIFSSNAQGKIQSWDDPAAERHVSTPSCKPDTVSVQ